MIRTARDRLAVLYATDLPDAEKRVQKAAIFADMRADHERIKAGWGGAVVFDRWFAGGANNAGIVSAGLYSDRVPQFAALLAAEGGDLPRFYARVKALAALPKAERDRGAGGGGRQRCARADRCVAPELTPTPRTQWLDLSDFLVHNYQFPCLTLRRRGGPRRQHAEPSHSP